jgi:acyl-homoserine-lactone acylase
MCKGFTGGMAPTTAGTPIAVGDSCATLAKWNDRENPSSRGAVLFRAFWENALNLPDGLWTHPFKASQPVSTPNGLNTSNPDVQKAFGDALATMTADHLPYNVALGTVQYVVRHGKHIALPGGPGDPDGEFNAIYQDVFDPAQRAGEPTIGSSYIQVVSWGKSAKCPRARTILTYSESANPKSRWYDDQTKLFSQRKWENDEFCSATVKKNVLTKTHLVG